MGDGWHQFNDRHGINNSYPTPVRGLEFHCHGENFEGPARLKCGDRTVNDNLTPGEALYQAGMQEFRKRFGDQR